MNTLLDRARQFAIDAHGDQKYGEHPYVYHLDAVAQILQHQDPLTITVGYLHDVLEDTKATPDDLHLHFGPDVTDVVRMVTDEPGANRRVRKERTNAKLSRLTGYLGCVALMVKAADRLANIRESAKGGPGSKIDMYRGEHAAFRAAAESPGTAWMWQEMDRLLGLAEMPTANVESH